MRKTIENDLIAHFSAKKETLLSDNAMDTCKHTTNVAFTVELSFVGILAS